MQCSSSRILYVICVFDIFTTIEIIVMIGYYYDDVFKRSGFTVRGINYHVHVPGVGKTSGGVLDTTSIEVSCAVITMYHLRFSPPGNPQPLVNS